ncbi:16S rRNA (guanine(966)-N(2))-methyltransferase RsmD [Simiduia sp. 21SJ11W-1]|uniref:16S rRNA (guanine(966)-N(2))-methyltransferase RsmD n=1 Tax=Simiduia sp. 21SJ11W-1 TaxID=2909669 RepID=UPI00209D994C|nr:16S rRNA (guanine(966)-N(2))-methyltransferase RsmD [Simiduia sp. 21SJ11W-1]UTA48014.1 16S rRNA (guanine(966)-N(2))-methyltransferase RsmD [Simiduia sp. 21SJ11W-1]
MKKRAPKAPAQQGMLRIIGGQWRGRKLAFPSVDGLRPTGDRVRETLFNWLQMDIPGSRCLDLFAGAGSLGLEALSRGCAHCTLIEKDTHAHRQLRENLNLLGASDAELVHADALNWLAGYQGPGFDVVFIDPPFSANLWAQAAAGLADHLNPGALIYLEAPAQSSVTCPPHWALHREKRAGDVCYRLYHCL